MCNVTPGTYRCTDCFSQHFLCQLCCVSAHLTLPFHRIRQFNGRYFEHSDLDQLGYFLDLRQHTHDGASAAPNMNEPLGSNHDLSEDDDGSVGGGNADQPGER